MAAQGEQRGDGPVTVAEVLALELLVTAEVEVVAGEEALGREVTWVHAGEIADIARYLRGGELLLTAGTGVGHGTADRVAYVQALAAAGASALVVEYGRAFRSIPAELRRAADEAGLPLAILRRTVPFAEVTRSVHAWIIGRRYARQARVERMALEFTDLLLAGGSVPQVVRKLHAVTGKPVVLEDAAHQLVECAGPEAALESLVSGWSAHSRTGHRRRPSAEAADSSGSSCAWAPVALRGEAWGRVHVITPDGIDELDLLAVDRASAAIGLALLNTEHHARLAQQTRKDLLDEAARRAPDDPATFLRQARSVGADFRGCRLVAFEAIAAAPPPALAETAASAARRHGLPALVSQGPEGCRLLVGIPEDRPTAEEAGELAEQIVGVHGGPGETTIGVSQPTEVARLPQAFHEAQECLRFARVSSAGGVLEHSTLGLHLLLATLSDGPELARFVETELGPLLDHDARARSPLLPTLRALLAHDSNRAEAARSLHVERRSIYYRIQRIEEILGQRLHDPDVKLGLGVALRALSLIEDRSVVRGRAAGSRRSAV